MAYFGKASKKVDKINAPLLVVGIGGTGADGVLRVKSEFSQRLNPEIIGGKETDHPPRTAYLVLDTDTNVLRKRYHGMKIDPDTEWFDMSCDMNFMLAPGGVNLTSQIKNWLDPIFYTDPHMRQAANHGAGTYRQLSRLMFFNRSELLNERLSAILQRLAEIPAGAPAGDRIINVTVITGLCGGTGSGAFLDFAYLLRHTAQLRGLNVNVELYTVSTDVMVNKLAVGDANKSIIFQTNSFAALKELDYWMNFSRRSDAHMPQEDLVVQYTNSLQISWDKEPYDDVTFLCGSNAQGVALQNAYNICLNAVAQVLLFTMAAEAAKENGDVLGWEQGDKTDDEDIYTFQSAKSNEHAYIRSIRRAYPQLYKYRSIGAFSNIGEQQNKVSIEADLLLSDVQYFCELEENMPAMNGNAPEKFFEPFQSKIQLLWSSFATTHSYPVEVTQGLPPYDMNAIKTASDVTAPHGEILQTWVKGLNGTKASDKAEFIIELEKCFEEMGRSYILTNGPKALKKMLDDQNTGFIHTLREKANDYSSQQDTYRQAYNNAITSAKDCFTQLKSLSLLEFYKAPKIFENYRNQIAAGFESKQYEVFFETMSSTLKQIATEITTQISEGGLKYTIQAVRQLQEEMSQESRNVVDDTGIPGRVQHIRDQIASQYQAEGIKESMHKAAMTAISNAAVAFTNTSNNQDAVAEHLIERLNVLIENIYSSINDMSLQKELAALGNQGGDAVADYAKQIIAPRLERGAQVLFALSPAYPLSTSTAVISSYISIPASADQVKTGIVNYISAANNYSGAVIKNSLVDDQIFWMNVATGMPLCAYQYLSAYETVYEAHKGRPGTHLVVSDDQTLQRLGMERTMENDWSLLPNPNPFKLMQNPPYPENLERRWNETEQVLSKAEELSVVYLDTTDANNPVGGVRLFMAGNQLMNASALNDKIKAAISEKTTPEEEQEALEGILAARRSIPLIQQEVGEDFNGVPLQIDKFATKLNLVTERERRQAFRELVYYRLSQRPGLILELKNQFALLETVRQQTQRVAESKASREKIGMAIRQIARMLLFGRIVFKMSDVRYLNDKDELETAGVKNVFYNYANSLHEGQPWVSFIPDEVLLVEWYAEQDHSVEPFFSIERKVESLYDKATDLDGDIEEDVAWARKLKAQAQQFSAQFTDELIKIKPHQKDMPRDIYNQFVDILSRLAAEFTAIANLWKRV